MSFSQGRMATAMYGYTLSAGVGDLSVFSACVGYVSSACVCYVPVLCIQTPAEDRRGIRETLFSLVVNPEVPQPIQGGGRWQYR